MESTVLALSKSITSSSSGDKLIRRVVLIELRIHPAANAAGILLNFFNANNRLLAAKSILF